jgi:glycosyltransferase involved in cell wall biosynthesis
MTSPRRLLLLTASMGRGGAEQQIVDLAVALRARGWTVAVLMMLEHSDAHSDHMDALAAAGIEFTSLGMTRGQATLSALLGYRSFVRRWRPDVVHSHMVHANLLARIGRVFAPRVPVVSTVHNVVEGKEGVGGMKGSRLREIAYRLTDRLASATTAVSNAATDRYIRVRAAPRDRIVTMPNGFNFSHHPVPLGAPEAVRRELRAEGSFLWVTAGRLVPEKGHDLLLRALQAIRQVHPNVRLAIAGEGPEQEALGRLIRELELEGSATLLGLRRDVPAILAAADAFVLSSYVEGLPMVLLEAAAQGLPIVSTDVGGCREVALPELGAVITETSAAAIATGMLHVMDLSADERAEIGQALQNHVRSEFNLDTIVDRWERLYASVIARRWRDGLLAFR